MANIALDEANKLQARIDKLVAARDAITTPKSKLWKEYEEINARLEKLQEQVDALATKAQEEDQKVDQEIYKKRQALDNEVEALVTARDALLGKASSTSRITVPGMWIQP